MSVNARRRPTWSRRAFFRAVGLAAGSLAVTAAGCGRRRREAQVTPPGAASATPQPSPQPRAVATVTPPPTLAPGAVPDMLLLNGKIITVDAKDSIAQALAIKDGRIQAVGADAQIKALAGPATKTIDLKGKAVTPGLIDAHCHLQYMGQTEGFYEAYIPPDVKSIKELQDKLAETIAKTRAGQWIRGYFLTVGGDGRVPRRQDLDAVSPNHPVWIIQQGGHYGTANSAGMKLAAITASTKDPVGGIIERDSRGEPTGVFYNHRAMDLVRRVIPVPPAEEVGANIVALQAKFAAVGITTLHDNNIRGVETMKMYTGLGKQGKLYLRHLIFYTLEWPEDLNRALHEIERYEDANLRMAGFKFLIDGQAPTAFCHAPHNGIRWNMSTWEADNFKQTVKALHDTGLQICVHCAGDAAADLTLDAYEAAMNANPRSSPRHRIEHAAITTTEATQRMQALDVVVSTQPQFLRVGADYWETIFGAERMRRAIVTREWLDAGVALALGSDAPTTPWYAPQTTLAGAVARLTLSNKVHEPAQCMTVQEALRAHTLGSAYAGHEEKIKGSLEPGKLADLAVWTEDPYAIKPERLWQTPVAMTMVGGKIVYQA